MTAYRRQRGDRVIYTAAQTARYKSQWHRWNRGRSLHADFYQRTGNVILCRFNSPRSAVGYWSVIVTVPGGDGGDGGDGGGWGSPDGWEPNEPNPGDTVTVEIYRHIEWHADLDDIGGGFYPSGPDYWWSGPAPSGNHGFDAGSDFTSAAPWRLYFYYLMTDEPSYQAGYLEGYFQERASVTLAYGEAMPPLPPGYDNLAGPPLAPDFSSGQNIWNPPPVTPPPPTGGAAACDCPDMVRKQAGINSPYPSAVTDRDWSSHDDTGAQAGDEPQWCKHIYSAVIDYVSFGNAGAVEPQQSSGSNWSPYWGAPSLDDLDWRTWRGDRLEQRRQDRINRASDWANFGRLNRQSSQDRWDRYNNLTDRQRAELYQDQFDRRWDEGAGYGPQANREFRRWYQDTYGLPVILDLDYGSGTRPRRRARQEEI